MTVLIVGGAGLVGSHLVRAFAPSVAVTYHRTMIDDATQLDVRDREQVRHVIAHLQPSVVIIAAAEPWVERCEREPRLTREVNVEGTRNVAGAAADVGATLVVFSSEYVFDGVRGLYTETDDVAPLNEYGRQKVEIESIARRVPDHLVCRTSGVFGVERARKNFVYQLIDRLRAGDTFDVPNDQLITPTYAPALAASVVALLQRGTRGIVHTVGPQVLPRVEFAGMVADAFGLPAHHIVPRPTSQLGSLARRPERAGLSDGLLRSLIGPLPQPKAGLDAMAGLGQ